MSAHDKNPTTVGPDSMGRHPFKGGRVDTIHGTPLHHTNRRIDEHEKTRDRVAHAHTDASGNTYRSTRGFAAAHVEDGKTFHPLPAIDVQPRHGGQPKGSPVFAHGAMHHTQDGVFNVGISKTASAAALAGYKLPTDPPIEGKRVAPAALHPSMASERRSGPEGSVGAKYDPRSGDKVLSEAVHTPDDFAHRVGRSGLPDAVAEQTDSGAAPKPWPVPVK